MKNLFKIILLAIVCFSCEQTFTPKPSGFNHIALPTHDYIQWENTDYPYAFEIFKNSNVIPYVTPNIKKEDDYVKILYPELGSSLWITYKKIQNNIDTLNSLISNSFRLADGHNVKATGMDSEVISMEKDKYATSVMIEGEVASQYQFFVHDSTTNFMRVALYFETATKNDSLAPFINYMKTDMHHLLRTLEWKNDGE